MTPETKIKNNIKKYLSTLNAFVWSHSDRFKKGYPDIEVIVSGRTIRFEVKSINGRVEPLQESTISRIKKAGGEAYVVRSVDEVKKIIDNSA